MVELGAGPGQKVGQYGAKGGLGGTEAQMKMMQDRAAAGSASNVGFDGTSNSNLTEEQKAKLAAEAKAKLEVEQKAEQAKRQQGATDVFKSVNTFSAQVDKLAGTKISADELQILKAEQDVINHFKEKAFPRKIDLHTGKEIRETDLTYKDLVKAMLQGEKAGLTHNENTKELESYIEQNARRLGVSSGDLMKRLESGAQLHASDAAKKYGVLVDTTKPTVAHKSDPALKAALDDYEKALEGKDANGKILHQGRVLSEGDKQAIIDKAAGDEAFLKKLQEQTKLLQEENKAGKIAENSTTGKFKDSLFDLADGSKAPAAAASASKPSHAELEQPLRDALKDYNKVLGDKGQKTLDEKQINEIVRENMGKYADPQAEIDRVKRATKIMSTEKLEGNSPHMVELNATNNHLFNLGKDGNAKVPKGGTDFSIAADKIGKMEKMKPEELQKIAKAMDGDSRHQFDIVKIGAISPTQSTPAIDLRGDGQDKGK
jgi:hypothetical protein